MKIYQTKKIVFIFKFEINFMKFPQLYNKRHAANEIITENWFVIAEENSKKKKVVHTTKLSTRLKCELEFSGNAVHWFRSYNKGNIT